MPVPGPTMMIGVSPFAGRRKPCEVCTKTGTGAVHAIREEGGADAFALAAEAFVTHRRDREMHLLGERLEARRDGIEPRIQLAQMRDELRRREGDRREIDEQVDDLAAVEVMLQRLFRLGDQQVAQRRIGRVFRDPLEELRRDLRDVVMPQQRGPQRRLAAIGRRHRFLAVAIERAEEVVDHRGAIRREHAERIAGLVDEPGAGERELEMARLLGRMIGGEFAVRQQLRGERVLLEKAGARARRSSRDRLRGVRLAAAARGGSPDGART